MERRTKARIVAVLYLILGVFFIVLGWNAKSWYPNMFASNTYYGEWGGTTLARVAAIVAGVLQVLIGSCMLLRKYGEAVLFGVALVLACLFFSIGAVSSGDDPSFQKVSGDDVWWFFGYFILLGVNLLFFIFIAPEGKPKASALTTPNVKAKADALRSIEDSFIRSK